MLAMISIDQAGERWRAMLAPIGEQRENLDRPILNGRSQVLDGH
jgi:hypothetical protein